MSIEKILNNCPGLNHIILDESFIHFKNDGVSKIETYFDSNSNLEKVIGIKSLSKDFGIAGVRAGYAILDKNLRNKILNQGFLSEYYSSFSFCKSACFCSKVSKIIPISPFMAASMICQDAIANNRLISVALINMPVKETSGW